MVDRAVGIPCHNGCARIVNLVKQLHKAQLTCWHKCSGVIVAFKFRAVACVPLTERNVGPVAQIDSELMNPSNLLRKLSAKLRGDGTQFRVECFPLFVRDNVILRARLYLGFLPDRVVSTNCSKLSSVNNTRYPIMAPNECSHPWRVITFLKAVFQRVFAGCCSRQNTINLNKLYSYLLPR